MALSCLHHPHVSMTPPPAAPPSPLAPRGPSPPPGSSGGPGESLPGMGMCHTRTRTNLGPDTHVPLGGGRRPGRGDREPLNPPAPGLCLLLLLPFLHPPPAASKGRGEQRPQTGLTGALCRVILGGLGGLGCTKPGSSNPLPLHTWEFEVPLGGVDVCFAGFCIISTQTVLATPAGG